MRALEERVYGQEQTVDKIINDWKQASVESTQMLKRMVDERRSRRI